MAKPMTPFRQVYIDGPRFGSHARVWEGRFDLGHPFNAYSDTPAVRNHSIRLLVENAKPTKARIEQDADVYFHEPLLLSAAVTTHNFRRVADLGPIVWIGGVPFTPHVVRQEGDHSDPVKHYSELRVTPNSPWPPASGFEKSVGKFQLAAPRLRATRGLIPVGCAKNPGSDKLAKFLSIKWDAGSADRALIFGSLRIAKRKTAMQLGNPPSVVDAISFDLTPDGVEFETFVPNPFGRAIEDLSLRLRLVAVDGTQPDVTDLQLDLIGGKTDDLRTLTNGLAARSRDLSTRRGALIVQTDSKIPPLSWPLIFKDNAYKCGEAGMIPAVRLREDGVNMRIVTREDFGGGEPGTAELTGHESLFAERVPTAPLILTVTSKAEKPPATLAAPNVTLRWSDPVPPAPDAGRDPDRIDVTAFSGIVKVEPLAARLASVWSTSDAIAPGTRPPCAFIAIERGWVQMPLPGAPKPDDPRAGPLMTGSAFRGLMRLALSAPAGSDSARLPGLGVTQAKNVTAKVTWTVPDDEKGARAMEVQVVGAIGTLEGSLWIGEASPSPVEVLPTLDSGPAALASVPIWFGVSGGVNWQVDVERFGTTGLTSARISMPPGTDGTTFPFLIWRPHATLALVASAAMTRTADSATRPSTTRELVPAEITGAQVVNLSFGPNKRLPNIAAPLPTTTLFGSGRWRWPWPPTWAAGPGSYPSSPQEAAGVALASLTLPGIEFTPAQGASTLETDLRGSLRYDLPILDELFAKAKAPEPKLPADPKADPAKDVDSAKGKHDLPPTALEPERLSGVWFDNARKLALARTEADRVVLKEESDGHGGSKVLLWHPLAGTSDARVRGLAEPYVWKPQTFSFEYKLPAMGGVTLGAYCLGNVGVWLYGGNALGGLKGDFNIDAGSGELQLVAGAALKVERFRRLVVCCRSQ